MNRVRLLPEQVANQIAAGEVIERPASVVKELVENSLDAQARRIQIDIQAGGRSLVRVTDDGFGMSRDDALLCLERHATSKIRRAEDLAAIGTMGFRGEALPSIASVSRFTLTTREAESESPEGTQIVISAGKILEVKAAGTAPGTTIEVRQLFSNLPARRKFLRTDETEAGHIQHYLLLAALSFPEVAFTFQRDGRLVWQLPAVKTGEDIRSKLDGLHERLRALYGQQPKMIEMDFTSSLLDDSEPEDERFETALPAPPQTPVEPGRRSAFRVWGFIGAPGVSRSTREDQHLFVNRRPVENRGLNYALLEGYHTALMKGRYPVCCLFIDLDPAAVDVNIHPAKREVKFHREPEIRRLVTQAIRDVLLRFHSGSAPRPIEPSLATPGITQMPVAASTIAPAPPEHQQTALPNFPAPLQPAPPPLSPAQSPLEMGFAAPTAVAPKQTSTAPEAPATRTASTEVPPQPPSIVESPRPQPPATLPLLSYRFGWLE